MGGLEFEIGKDADLPLFYCTTCISQKIQLRYEVLHCFQGQCDYGEDTLYKQFWTVDTMEE
jgi:hypothetical protein